MDSGTILGGYRWADPRQHGFAGDRVQVSEISGVILDGISLCGLEGKPYRSPVRSFDARSSTACADCVTAIRAR